MDKYIDKLTEIASLIFNNKSLQLSSDTKLSDIKEWDSISHIQFINTIENEFGIKFSLDEMINISTVEMIIDIIKSKA